MKITQINYSKLFPIGNFLNERIGMEAQLDDGEDAQAKLLVLKGLVEDFHQRNNPGVVTQADPSEYAHLFSNAEITPPERILQSIDPRAKDQTEIDIDNATTIEQLSTVKEAAAKYNLMTAYMGKLKSLS